MSKVCRGHSLVVKVSPHSLSRLMVCKVFVGAFKKDNDRNRQLSEKGVFSPGARPGTYLRGVWVAPDPDEAVVPQGFIAQGNAGDHRLVQLWAR